jgi:hypothetical protein
VSLSPPERSPIDRVLALDLEHLAWVQNGGAAARVMSWPYREASTAPLKDAMGAVRPGPVDLIVCNDTALHWLQAPPTSVSSFAELQLVAGARCAHLHGGSPADWRIAADWQTSRPFMCAAVPQDTALKIEQALSELNLKPRWHSAWSVLCCAATRILPPNGWSAVRTPTRVMLWHCRAGRVDCFAAWAVSPTEGSASAARRAIQQMHVENARSGHTGADALHWLDFVDRNALCAGELSGVTAVWDARLDAAPDTDRSEAAVALALASFVKAVGS